MELAHPVQGSLTMRVAIPEWQGRVAPVLDAAQRLAVIDIEDGRETGREYRRLSRTDPFARAGECAASGVDVLICGALSALLEAKLVSSGVTVIGFVRGEIDRVLGAFTKGELASPAFFLPGCGRRRRVLKEKLTMRRDSGTGFGGGPGGGRRAGGGRRKGGPLAAGPGGDCVCPQCGQKTAHAAGQPCNQTTCPKCGTVMIRG